jgi:hypothetical protein
MISAVSSAAVASTVVDGRCLRQPLEGLLARDVDPCGVAGGPRLAQPEALRDKGDGAAVAQDVTQFGGLEQRVDGHHHQARLEDGEIGHEKVESVGHLHRDPVAAGQSLGEQAARDPVRRRVELGV